MNHFLRKLDRLVALAALEGTLVRAEGHGGLGDDLAESLALLADRVGVDRSGGELVVPAAAKGLHLRGEGAEERGDVELSEESGEHDLCKSAEEFGAS